MEACAGRGQQQFAALRRLRVSQAQAEETGAQDRKNRRQIGDVYLCMIEKDTLEVCHMRHFAFNNEVI